jgi:asparagine synthase (glutamine-hydrolysing)
MSMASGLELRVPFVDSRLIETLSRIPAQFRLEQGKQLLVSAVPEIPEWVRLAPKRGFTFPFEHWLAVGWYDLFERLDQASPVPLQSWYRRWSLLVLEHFLTTHKLETDRRLGASA